MTKPQLFPPEPGLLGIIGNPVRVSLSPAMRQAVLRRGQTVKDIVYRPRQPPLLIAAKAAGTRTVDGLQMLLHLGALAFTLRTGREAPSADSRRALARAAARAERRL